MLDGSNIQILDVRTDDTDQVRAKANVADTTRRSIPISPCLVGLWAYNGPAIVNALREANKTGQVEGRLLSTKTTRLWPASKTGRFMQPSFSNLTSSDIRPYK